MNPRLQMPGNSVQAVIGVKKAAGKSQPEQARAREEKRFGSSLDVFVSRWHPRCAALDRPLSLRALSQRRRVRCLQVRIFSARRRLPLLTRRAYHLKFAETTF